MSAQPRVTEMDKPEWLTQMKAVLEVLNEGVVITNDSDRILFANSRFVEMTGIPKRDLLGSDSSQFYSSTEWGFLTKQIDIAFRQGRNSYEFVLPKRDGGRLPVIISSRALESCGGRFRVVTFTDISKQVTAEQELRSANARLRQRQLEIEEDLLLAARVQTALHRNPWSGTK